MPDNRSKRPLPAVMDAGTFRGAIRNGRGLRGASEEHPLGTEPGAVHLPGRRPCQRLVAGEQTARGM